MRFRVLSFALLLACSSSPDAPAVDAATDAPKLGVKAEDGSVEASSDVAATDAPVDVAADVPEPVDASDAGSADAAPDVVDAATEAGSLGGDYCPIFGSTQCVNGFEFRTHVDGGNTDYNCGAVTPHCPKGWVCWALDSQNVAHYATCP